MKLISRKEAKDKGLKRYFTGKLCPHGHIEERMVSNGYCIECSKKSKQQYVENNVEKVRQELIFIIEDLESDIPFHSEDF